MRLNTCENALPEENPDSKPTCSIFSEGSASSSWQACSMRKVLMSL